MFRAVNSSSQNHAAETHLVSVGLHDPLHHVAMLLSRLHADQVVVPVPPPECSAVFQRLLPRLVLLHQDQVVPVAEDGEAGGAVSGGHVFTQRRDGGTVAFVAARLSSWPTSVLRQASAPLPCSLCRTDGESVAKQTRWTSACLLFVRKLMNWSASGFSNHTCKKWDDLFYFCFPTIIQRCLQTSSGVSLSHMNNAAVDEFQFVHWAH